MSHARTYGISADGVWAGTRTAAEMLGITFSGMILLQRDKQIAVDCQSCGKNRFKVVEINEKREDLRQYLRDTYKDSIDDLFLPEQSDTLEVSSKS